MKQTFYISLKFVAILLLILFAVDWFISTGIKKNDTGIFGKINKICNQNKLPQIAIFSSSVGEMGLDSKVIQTATSQSTYNFALNGTRFMQYKGLVNEIGNATNNTKIIVFAETFFSFEKLSGINQIERYVSNISNKNIYNSLYNLQPDLAFKCRYIPFYKYVAVTYNYYLQSVLGWKNFITKKIITDTLLGQTKVNRKWQTDQDSILKYMQPITVTIDSEILVTYKQTINNLVANGKKIVITIPPMYMQKEQKILDITLLKTTLKSIANNKTIFFFDFSESMVDKQYFYNAMHLNAFGAAVFSKRFADSLNTITK